jgi:hypothetical protein
MFHTSLYDDYGQKATPEWMGQQKWVVFLE